ncbi:tRNA (adenosine(37)-N6)-threonylcarbamoyltransferase complex dimerization subunit type 1 TsaB [Paraflavitalea sp. CAU 1676]|uniref:tRNA (adenosine(37)-N6)-threonylcarbamoyltransferase complex dimerization subunit type 1 TsaB n=1 Tax=Paraflavitalea sp. CAU 1676 TaxID=3032598 RepID=UPI0023DB25AB|nr:tRNA (adenosine(37)-N6)-threonylcarbamoyltransferase complex dimerization subunit type 1 TsaB [Paraflavitalea sp. CAU 1676]MDF2186984.1 tRNA (adenosine(37)-N6)-threonylcarbamoyltransferase complex dimerization subunit type 1 TsaB [Paraflavitalea sp. CAU 1676]
MELAKFVHLLYDDLKNCWTFYSFSIMGLILNIDTATEIAGVCLATNGTPLATMVNREQKDHASWVQPAIASLMQEAGYAMGQLEAVAVTAGPGSYTGLRVGMATAKGLCYALHIPLITDSTLKVIAYATRAAMGLSTDESPMSIPTLLCPMIDARRMEVFTGVYNLELGEVIPGGACVLDESSFNKELENNRLIFCGNGVRKWKPLCKHSHAMFYEGPPHSVTDLAALSEQRFQQQEWADLAYAEPAYLKEFYSHIKN